MPHDPVGRLSSSTGLGKPTSASSASDRALAFYRELQAEVIENRTGLDLDHYGGLSRYYRSLKDNASMRPFYRYNWTRRVAPMLEIVLALPRRGRTWRILDAGCGLGTESIFWSALRNDLEVVGVDIQRKRLAVARARQKAYEERLGRKLAICFLERDVFGVLKDQRFDLVWSMESISHIDPAEGFLARASVALSPTGYLVVSDSHLANPVMVWRVWRLRTRGIGEHTQKRTASGQCLSYAQERLFTVRQLSRMLRRVGFRSVRSHLCVYFPPALARSVLVLWLCIRYDALLARVPLIRSLGGIYTIVASK